MSNLGGQQAAASNLLKALDQQQQQQQQQLQQNVVRSNPPGVASNQLRHIIRREAHNYDKQLPTAHQTLMYNQIISEQQQQQPTLVPQQQQQQVMSRNDLQGGRNAMEQSYQQQQQQQELLKAHYLFKPIDDVNMMALSEMDESGDGKDSFGRSNSLPVNASMQMMSGGGLGAVVGAGMFEMGIEGVAERLQTTQIRVGENQFLSPRNKVQQQQQQQQQSKYHIGGLQQQQQLQQHSSSSQQLSSMLSRHGAQKQQQFHAMHTTNSEPALIQLLQKPGGGGGGLPKDQLHGQRPYPLVKLEKSQSFHAADTNNNCDAGEQQHSNQSNKTGLAFVAVAAGASGSGGGAGVVFEKKMSSPLVSPVTAAASLSPDASMEVALKLNISGGMSSGSCSNVPKKEAVALVDGGVGGSMGELLLSNEAAQSNKRSGHIYSEQKRRIHIKNGFDLLHSLIPQLQQSSSSASKMSKAAVLQKGAEYIKQLKIERVATNEKMERLRKERDALNNQISLLHAALPANGAPVSRQRTGKIMDMYNQYVLNRTYENWKFWIVSIEGRVKG